MWREAADEVIKPVLYAYLTRGNAQNDRELAHKNFLKLTEVFEANPLLRKALGATRRFRSPRLQTELFGKTLPHPYGLSAGIEKGTQRVRYYGEGEKFSWVDNGTLTLDEYPGNQPDQPRIELHVETTEKGEVQESLSNCLGYPNLGLEGNAPLLWEKWPRVRNGQKVNSEYLRIISMSASKRSFDAGTAIEDIIALNYGLQPYGDVDEFGFSPNTPQTFRLLSPETLAQLLKASKDNWYMFLSSMDTSSAAVWEALGPKPTIVKFGPDLSRPHLRELVQAIIESGLPGRIGAAGTNTTQDSKIKERLTGNPNYLGGFSGACLTAKSQEVCEWINEFDPEDKLVKLFGGGLLNTKDDWDRFSFANAHALGVLSSYVTPHTASLFFTWFRCQRLDKAMKVAGVNSIVELRGSKKRYPFMD